MGDEEFMDMTATGTTTERESYLDELYEATTKHGYPPIQFRVFDVQLCGSLKEEWLTGAVQLEGVTPEELKSMIGDGLLRTRTNAAGETGYLLYTPYQVEVLKKLRQTRRYDVEELRHIMSDWEDYLDDVVIHEPDYDDDAIPDYDHFVRRLHEIIALFEEDEHTADPVFIPSEQWEQQKARSRIRAAEWRRVLSVVDRKSEQQLSDRFRDFLHRQLFHWRWWDEYVRFDMAKQFDTAILLGYSTDVSFRGHTSKRGMVTFHDIDWSFTLRRYRQTRHEGNRFPLRTPDFNITEHGVEFLSTPSPQRYAELYGHYRLEQLDLALTDIGPDLWKTPDLPIGDAICPACEGRFLRTSPKRAYCSDTCRIRAKSRRARERDPEKTRQAQARYWKTAYPEG